MAKHSKLFDHRGVRYEVACGFFDALISHLAEMLAEARGSASPEELHIASLVEAQNKLRDARAALDANDPAAIEAAVATYGPQARAAYLH